VHGALPECVYDRAMQRVTGFVLAGGKSTRMGQDKATMLLAGTTLLERALAILRQVTPEVVIVGSPEKYAELGHAIADLYPDHGPLGGIHTALTHTTTEFNLILAVDMPKVSAALLRFLLAEASASAALITACRVDRRWQPLGAVYRKDFADHAQRALEAGRNKVEALFTGPLVHEIDEAKLKAAGFTPEIFCNLNTPEEYATESRGKLKAPGPN
jgi:molybdenum cofactor guanylyltransferase